MKRMSSEWVGWIAAMLAGAALCLGGCAPSEEAAEEDLDELEDGKDDSLAKVKVTTSKGQYGLKDAIVATVANNYKVTAIYLPGCNATGLQRQSGKTWTDLGPEKACFWDGFAMKVAPAKTLADSYGPKPSGTYRVKVLYKTGCTSKQTFSQCQGKLRTVYSTAFTVGQVVKTCGSSAACASSEYCQLPDGACLSAATNLMTGTCKPRPQVCYEIYKPVCGCDGQTHGNDCYAALAGTSIASQGECGTPCGDKVCGPTQTCCEGMPLLVPTCFEGTACPKSKREVKTDVRYLRTAELEQLREALLKFRLASYRYKKGAGEDPQPTHLGFIIDDVAPSPSVEARGDRVNLYGYTSMAVATLQVQARQIEALQREVKELRAALKRKAR